MMERNPGSTVFIGNLDERVTDKTLYEILIQAGRVVDLRIPWDRETNRLKGYAFAEYETEEIADYAVRLFRGSVRLYDRTLEFEISGLNDSPQDRNPACVVSIGNLDERVTGRVLYEILIQVGRVVDLHMPPDRETNSLKGYALAEYETEEIANYAVKLFSGLVRLYDRTLTFQIARQEKSASGNLGTSKSKETPESSTNNSK